MNEAPGGTVDKGKLGFPFLGIAERPPKPRSLWGGITRAKPLADVYVDDKAIRFMATEPKWSKRLRSSGDGRVPTYRSRSEVPA
jgi:hypothetical protein